MSTYDVSIILNCHSEDIYLQATLESLNDAITKASKQGISVELIAILDNVTTVNLERLIRSFYFTSLNSLKIKHVKNGSLGPSRNDGIDLSEGEYIITADADDLISDNFITAGFKAAKNYNQLYKKDAIFIPQYVYSFGTRYSLNCYFSSKYFSPSDIVAYHPFVSRIFVKRSLLNQFRYKDLRKSSGFAFEDWDLNARFYATHYEIVPLTDVVMFYRQHSQSIMAATDYVRLIPPSQLVTPESFIKLVKEFKRPDDFDQLRKYDTFSNFFGSSYILRSLYRASEIDPSIAVCLTKDSFASIGKNIDSIYLHWAHRLAFLHLLTNCQQFDDLYLISDLKNDIYLKYIQHKHTNNPDETGLIITTERLGDSNCLTSLPDNLLVLNFNVLSKGLSESNNLKLLIHFILSVTKSKSNIHVMNESRCNKLILTFGQSLKAVCNVHRYIISTDCSTGKTLNPSLTNQLRNEFPYITTFIFIGSHLYDSSLKVFGQSFHKKLIMFKEDFDDHVIRNKKTFSKHHNSLDKKDKLRFIYATIPDLLEFNKNGNFNLRQVNTVSNTYDQALLELDNRIKFKLDYIELISSKLMEHPRLFLIAKKLYRSSLFQHIIHKIR